MALVRDGDIRPRLRATIAASHAGEPGTKIVDELGLCQGQVRVDIAVVNGALKGYEIKSLADTLKRLPNQVAVYSDVLDYAAIVLAERHRADAEAVVPGWWEIVVAVQEESEIQLHIARRGSMNPAINKRALAELLWHREALQLLRDRAAHRGLSRQPRSYAWDRVAEVCALDELRDAVRARLKERQRLQSAPSPP